MEILLKIKRINESNEMFILLEIFNIWFNIFINYILFKL